VMQRDPQHWYGSVAVDAGADRGVSLNDPVLGRRGDDLVAVGRIVEVRPRTSLVMLLTDQRSAAAAYLSSGTLEGLVQGQDAPHLKMNYINTEAHLVPDDAVYTSPTSATFPPDVLIGRVAQVNPRDPFLAFQSVDVAPALDGAALQEVLILRAHAPAGEAPLPAPPPLAPRPSAVSAPQVSTAPAVSPAAAPAKRPGRAPAAAPAPRAPAPLPIPVDSNDEAPSPEEAPQ
jgi:cell shape-determining protein MreC